MSYAPSDETINLPHVVEDINGNVLALTPNWAQAHCLARYQDRFLMVSTIIRLANEDDIGWFNRRLGDC